MKDQIIPRRLALIIALIALSTGFTSASASVLSVAGNDTLVGNRAANLIVNGSFEVDGGLAPNGAYWATGTSLTPTMSLTGWTATGQAASYAIWGSDGFGGTKFSDMLPHGTNGLYFGGGIMVAVIPFPTEANNGLVTFASAPVITPAPTDGPVTLQQTVSGLNPSATYVLDFWTSGEGIGPMGFAVDGFFGLDITGESRLYFAAPSGNGPIGNSQRYQVYFKPTASTITFTWINWGHYSLSVNALSDELVLDDVILNLLTNTPPPIDCNCLTNITVTCPGFVPDLCVMAANCFGTNLLPGSCIQNFPPGMQLVAGTYPLTLQVMDLQSNVYNCTISFTVLPQSPPPPLTVVCPTNKTVECGSGWSFDSPVVLSSCCGVNITTSDSIVSNGVCSQVITRTWTILDGCGNQKICSQTVTTQDTTPPGTQCGQNLVPNPSFEQFTGCPGSISMFDLASPWFTPTDATTDLYSPCAGPASYTSTPTNLVGVQIPMSGQCYAGAVVWSVYGLNTNNTYRNYREYLEVPLLAPLTAGQQYQVSFYVSRADKYRYAIAELGAYFSFGPMTGYGTYTNFNVVPQVENPSANILASTNAWMLVQGTFTALGGESYLTLGNFRTDANTTVQTFPPGPVPDYAYYLFDDVSVIALCDPMTNKVVQCGDPWTFDNVTPFDNCTGNNVTTFINTTTNGVCPKVITRTWSLADACGNTNQLTQTVTIVDTNPPTVMCAGGANLVPNGNFENYSACPSSGGQISLATPWFAASDGTCDYYNSCAAISFLSTPTNGVGDQIPLSGQAYAGIFVYGPDVNVPGSSYREYIEVPLLAPLVAGQTYRVRFNVSRAEHYAAAIAEIGAYFSPGPIVSNGYTGALNFVPQVVNPSANMLVSTTAWMQVQGTFTAAGGESYLTLGNFRTDGATTAIPAAGLYTNMAYYYFDDVSVETICPSSVTNKIVQCGQPWNFNPPIGIDQCSGTNVTVTVASTVTNGICPKVITRTWALADLCGNTNTWSQTVTIVDTNPPVVLCGNGINLVPNSNFESYTNCPTYASELAFAPPWFDATGASPDYFNACGPPGSIVLVPSNMVGVQTAHSGKAYAGAIVWTTDGADAANSYREYFEASLLTPLVAGQVYVVSFYVSLADSSSYGIAEIGAHFSVGPLVDYASQVCLPVVPQVVNPANNLLTSTNSWMLVQGAFTAAGGEDHITLGNFLSDVSTTAVPSGGTNFFAYYYFDDVSVSALCDATGSDTNVPCGSPWDFTPPVAFDACSGTNVAVTVMSTVTNSICPFSATRTWWLVDLCGNSNHWSQTVTINNNNPPILLCPTTNLVPNPSFENYTNCPDAPSEPNYAAPWYRPSDGTSDYFNACATLASTVSVPTNFPGVQTPFSGQGYCGAFLYQPGGANMTNSYREYLQTPLLAPLVAGQSYTVSFYVNRSDNYAWAIAEIGAHFSVGPMVNFVGPGSPVFPVTPQVENSSANLLTSTNAWMLVQGTFTASGGENYLTLGNFRSDANTTAVLGSGPYANYAYYYFDEVSVVPGCPQTNKIVPCGAAWTFDTPVGFDPCSGTNVAFTLVGTVTNSVCPLSVTRNWILASQCSTNNWSQTVRVTNNSPLAVNCDCLQDTALSLLTTNGCTGIVPDLSVLTNSICITGGGCGTRTITQSPAAGTVVGSGSHNITVNIFNCGGMTNTCVLPFNVNPPLPVLNCPPNLYFLTCGAGIVVNYTVTATGYNGNIVCSPPSGSVFPLGTTPVVCTATNNCGGVTVNGFYVIVQPQTARWSCWLAAISVIVNLPPSGVQIVHLPDYPGGGAGVNFENSNASVPADVQLDFGPAQKITFSTVLDFNVPAGATFALALPPDSSHPNGTPLVTFERGCAPHCGWNLKANKNMIADTSATFRSIAVGTNGELFSSFTHDGASLETNILASITPMAGATNAQMTVTLDCGTREVALEFPSCTWTPAAARKGWDGCIYGNHPPRGSTGNKTARLIITPITHATLPPLTMLDLVASNLTEIAFDNPSITALGRKWGDGHVTLLKAYDDGANAGMEFFALGDGGGPTVELGHAANFQFHVPQFQDGTVPNQSQVFRVKGWPPGTTTNRPPPPVFNLRLAQNPDLGGVDCSADFSEWGVSNVTVQLWNGTMLVGETNHVPATLANALVTMSDFPAIVGCPSIGVVSLSSTNPVVVFSGLHCSGTTGCVGTELRIIAEMSTMSTPPTAFTGLDCHISDGMDNLIYGLQTTPACSPVPLNVNATPAGLNLNWQGDGFRLQGAETVSGPWYDLGVDSPVNLPANYALRFFRLMCD